MSHTTMEHAVTLSPEDRLALYRTMLRIRRFEERTSELYRDGAIPGFVHVSIGQEAVATGACWPLRTSDAVTSTHRGHGHCLAKGADMTAMFAELMGRDGGTCRGRGGSMHIADVSVGVFGANGIVAGGLPIAIGAAAAFQRQERDDVVVAFFGDGAVAQGAFHESLNLAALWRLPVLFVCENNGFAEFSAARDQHPVPVVERAAAYGVQGEQVDGCDVEAMAAVCTEAVDALRSGDGPVLLEAITARWHGHYEGDVQRYRDEEEMASNRGKDPLTRLVASLDDGDVGAVVDEVNAEVDAAIAGAEDAPEPDPGTLHRYVLRASEPVEEPPPPPVDASTFRYMDAVREALAVELESDDRVWLAGIDIGEGGGIFAVTRGLADRFPGRVVDTPIAETAIMGLAVGGAMAGSRPVVELMFMDFLGVCLDQLMNQAAKLHYMTGGQIEIPLVVRTQFGSGRASGSQHSQSLETLVSHIPGLMVVMPSNPADAYGLLRAAIQEPNPVVFVENRHLYGMKGPRPPADHLVPLGRARVVRPGSDVTLVSWSRMLNDALAAAETLAGHGIEAEVIDVRTLAPIDDDTIIESVRRTGRLAVAHEAVTTAGMGAEITARVAGAAFDHLRAPAVRVAPPHVPVPYAPSLEGAWLPGVEEIVKAVQKQVR